MSKKLFEAIQLLQAEKGIPAEYILERLEPALTKAVEKEYGATAKVRVVTNKEKCDIKVYLQKTVVAEVSDPVCEISLEEARALGKRCRIGSVIETKLSPDSFKRLSASAGKSIIIQGIREAERNHFVRAYEDKQAKIVSATVYKVDDTTGDLILDIPDGHARLSKEKQLPTDDFQPGDRLRVYVSSVHSAQDRGPVVELSRVETGFIQRLFEAEIPEIQDGTVRIANISREAGSRSKVAVYSTDPNVDPVGACIGPHGARINAVLDELGKEKIDLCLFREDLAEFIRQSLSPAQVMNVIVTPGERTAQVVVDPSQLSLAIGPRGQNVRLAAQLTNCKIDITAE